MKSLKVVSDPRIISLKGRGTRFKVYEKKGLNMKFTHEERGSWDYYTVTSDNGIKIEFWGGSPQTATIEAGTSTMEEVDAKSEYAHGIAFWFDGVPLTLYNVYLKLENWLEEIQDEEREEGEIEYDAPIVL